MGRGKTKQKQNPQNSPSPSPVPSPCPPLHERAPGIRKLEGWRAEVQEPARLSPSPPLTLHRTDELALFSPPPPLPLQVTYTQGAPPTIFLLDENGETVDEV